jgi:hypothetical protein
MFDLHGLNELSCIDGSEQIIEKVQGVLRFAEGEGFAAKTGKSNFINFRIDEDIFTAELLLSFSYRFPTAVKDCTIAPFFTIGELAYFKGSGPLADKIEKVLASIRDKGYSAKMSPSGLEIKKNILTASLSLQFSFQEPSLRPFISSKLSGSN